MTTSPSAARLAGAVARTTARVVAEATRLRLTPDELPGLRLPWYEVHNAAPATSDDGEDVRADILIFDEIGGSMGVNANDLVAEIKEIDAPINVRINSPGGSVFEALAIRSALEHHPHDVRVYVDGIAASAASVIALGGNEVVMMPGSQLMIHDASAPDNGNPEDHRNLATFLDRQSDNIADLYRIKGGGTVDQWRAAMQDETWYFAKEAVDAGLADRVWPSGDVAESSVIEDPEMTDKLTRSFDLSHYRYAGRQAAPPPGSRPRVARASVRDRERAPMSRAAAAQERARAFTSGAPVTMPDLSTRTQTRTQAVSLGDKRENINFPTTMRASLDTTKGKDLYHVHGYASVYDRAYPMWDSFGEYEEVVVHGAFTKTLASDPDVAFLVNHAGVTMARTTNGTLSLAHDMMGLITDAWLNPARKDVSDVILAIEDEMITEMSFAFMIPEDGGRWSDDFSRFEIRDADINRGDVSAVNYGASPWTSIAARAREVLTHAGDLPEGMKRALAAKLGTPLNRRVRQADTTDLNVVETRLLSETPTPSRPAVPAPGGRKLSVILEMLKDD